MILILYPERSGCRKGSHPCPKRAIVLANIEKPAKAEVTKPRAERPHKGLTLIQEELAELAADLLLNGGARTDADLFLKALSRHSYRRFLSQFGTVDKSEQEIDQHGTTSIDRWYRHLSKNWPDARTVFRGTSSEFVGSVKEIVRANLLWDVRSQFDHFLASTEGVENLWMLNEVLENATSGHGDVAEAFAQCLNSDDTYVRVPWGLTKEVSDFIALLEKRAAWLRSHFSAEEVYMEFINTTATPGACGAPDQPAGLLTQVAADNAAAELLRETILLEQQRLAMRRRMHRIAELLAIVKAWAQRKTARGELN